MKFDGNIDIAEGRKAWSRKWENKEVKWSWLVERLSVEHKTTETARQYEKATRDERSKIKDVGGFVGAYLRGGTRKPKNVVTRKLITLDIDFAHLNLWDDITLIFENAALLHSTHSHTEENPKYRLVMPLNRDCSPEEYEAVARRVAGRLNVDLFDKTTFQPERLMFWPSNPSDIEYYVVHQDGPWLDVDATLASYKDWTDSSLWPTSEAQLAGVKSDVDKQADPREKRGIVGSFCRTYDIHEAIATFLHEEYERVGDERYTYKLGSTGKGVITYDDLYAYSHHGTDPISGHLCNAFDVVRMHKFSHLDTDTTSTGAKRLSYKAMESLALKDKAVRRTVGEDTMAALDYDFADGYEVPKPQPKLTTKPPKDHDGATAWRPEVVTVEDPLAWMENLEMEPRGGYKSKSTNLNLIVANDPHIAGAFAYNAFDFKRYLLRSVPWRVITAPEPAKNVDYSGIRNYIETTYGIAATGKIDDCLALEFEKNSFHPVQEYLAGLSWDGKKRVDSLLVDYFGADDNAYTREAARKMLTGAVARVREPGCKFDLVLVLVSEEGTGKSTFIRKLGNGWSSDSFHTVQGTRAFEQLQGAWLIEMAELSGMRKADVEAVKHFITIQTDSFRPAYARVQEDFPRQCIFIATTNKSDFLQADNNNRRFMPVDVHRRRVKKSVWDMPQEEIDQIWAEAVTAYEAGERLYLTGEAEAIAKTERRNHAEIDERHGLLVRYLDTLLPENWASLDIYDRRMFLENPEGGKTEREFVCVAEVWAEALGNDPNKIDAYRTREIHSLLRGIEGWEVAKNTKRFGSYGVQRYYTRQII